MKIKIEKNIPVSNTRKPKTGISEKIQEMEVGDSFVIESDPSKITSVYNAIKHVRHWRDMPELQFKSKTLENGKRRFWRIA